MVLETAKKGLKQATKGSKQIELENASTLKFYSIMVVVSLALAFIFSSSFSYFTIFAMLVQGISVGGMYHRAKCGIDLNLEGGFADYMKDTIITTSICTGLSVISRGFWALWLWLPGFAVYKIWVTFIAPWIFAPAPEEDTEMAEKKRKKKERKLARAGYR